MSKSKNNKKLDQTQWYDLLLKACENGDEALLDRVLDNLDDCTMGQELPLTLALCQTNTSLIKKILNRLQQYAAPAFLHRLKSKYQPLSKADRAQLFKLVLPHFEVPMNDKKTPSYDLWAYAVYLLTPQELGKIPFTVEGKESRYNDLTKMGLRWCLDHPPKNGKEQTLQKVKWAVQRNLLSEEGCCSVMDKLTCFGHTQAALEIASAHPDIKALTLKTVETLFYSRNPSQLKEVIPLLPHHNLSLKECRHVVQKWRHNEYQINALEYLQYNCDMVDFILPFVRPLAKNEETSFLRSWMNTSSPYVMAQMQKEFPTLWDWDQFYTQAAANTKIALTLEEEWAMIAPSLWPEYVAQVVGATYGKSSWLFKLKKSDYRHPKIVRAILGSQNQALVNKCLFEGGKVEGVEQWLQLSQWSSEEFFVKVWKQMGAPSIVSNEQLAAQDCEKLLDSILSSRMPHRLLTKQMLTDWIEKASDSKLETAAIVAARHKSPIMLDAVLKKAHLSSDSKLEILNQSIKDIPTLQVAVQYIDPHQDTSSVLCEAAENNMLDAVQYLIPLCNPRANNSAALRVASELGHLRVVEALLPVSCAKDKNSRSLTCAVDGSHEDVALLLWPHSDIEEAREHVENTDLFDRYAALWQKNKIQQSLPVPSKKEKEGRKM